MSLYDPELVYVTAYMEEERLEGIAPGNPVWVWCDAISGSMAGRVVWVERATGANFALLPRDVSSGEFTKVTQRIPIRIALERGPHWGRTTAWALRDGGDLARTGRPGLGGGRGDEGEGAGLS